MQVHNILSPPDRYSEMQPPPPPTAPGAHDAGINYGEIAPDIAADNMAAHIAAKADQEMWSSARSGGKPSHPPAPAPAQGDGFSGRGPRSTLRAPPEYTEGELETALRNFEDFHRLPSGSATVEQLQSSSAKIGGWLRAGQGREARASEQHAPVSGPPVACRRRMRLGVPLRSFGEAGQAADEATIEQLLRDTADPLPLAPGEWQGPRAGLLG